MSKEVLAIIPARSGSKGIPGKNMVDIGGLPLIHYTIQTIQQSNAISCAMVSTDDAKTGEYCLKHNIEFPFIRPDELSSDTAKSIDVVIHALNWYINNGRKFDFVLLLQPTTPFRDGEWIDAAIKKLESSQLNALISLKPVPHDYNPNWQFRLVQDEKYVQMYEGEVITRRQDLSPTFIRDGAIYLTRVDYLLRNKSFFDERMEFIIDTSKPKINIDTYDDLAMARKYVEKS